MEKGDDAQQLPSDVWLLILTHFHARQLFLCSRVCKEWRVHAPKAMTSLRGTDLLQKGCIHRLSEMVNLTSLDMRQFKGKRLVKFNSTLLPLDRLLSLYADSNTFTDVLTRSTNLTLLDWVDTQHYVEAYGYSRNLHNTTRCNFELPLSLRVLRLECMYIYPNVASVVSRLTNLTELRLWRCLDWDKNDFHMNITLDDLAPLTQLVSLRLIDSEYNPALECVEYGVLRKLAPQIEKIHLRDNTLTELGDNFLKMTRLRSVGVHTIHGNYCSTYEDPSYGLADAIKMDLTTRLCSLTTTVTPTLVS